MEKRKKELTICSNSFCGVEFLKDKSEINRNKKLGRKNYCSLKCSGMSNHSHLQTYIDIDGNNVKPYSNNKKDKFTGLREHFRRIKKRHHNYDVNLDDLLYQWNTQSGICVYSGVKLIHPNQGGNNLNTSSLDRIDSSLGYVKGNIQFISMACNYAKNSMTHEEMISFCMLITKKFTQDIYK